LLRFDYTPEDCVTFHESVKKYIVPLYGKLQQKHKEALGVDDYRPWDTEAVLTGEKPLRPYESTEELVEGVLKMLKNTDEYFYNVLNAMKEGKTLDLKSRKAKSPGGFCTYLPITELSFIFMNEANSQSDLTTLVHESGHSVHDMLCSSQEAFGYMNTPSEIAEVASMGMELLSMDKWQEFYKEPEELKRAVKEQLKGILKTIIWVMVVDKFQMWIYTNPEAYSDARNDKFAEIASEFSEAFVNWRGYEQELKHMWKKQLHIFEVPFYYIEYAIAQLGAVQLWRNYKNNPEKAVEKYKEALSLGSSKSLPELYETMGIKFDFSENTIKELMDFVWNEIEELN
uniref:M3 family metallopeptidase n=1 Tax=Clostridium polynesiense TaxID=1325933 RepID=UPI00058E1766